MTDHATPSLLPTEKCRNCIRKPTMISDAGSIWLHCDEHGMLALIAGWKPVKIDTPEGQELLAKLRGQDRPASSPPAPEVGKLPDDLKKRIEDWIDGLEENAETSPMNAVPAAVRMMRQRADDLRTLLKAATPAAQPVGEKGLIEAATELLRGWTAFKESYGNQENAYYCLAKGKHEAWEKLSAALAQQGSGE